MVKLTYRNYYTTKDQLKADNANKFIGHGSKQSSTNQYRLDYADSANTGSYNEDDIVFISAEGNRAGRLKPDFQEISLAIKAKVWFITDNSSNRNRSYNIGEREVANFLLSNGFEETEYKNFSVWKPITHG